MTIFSDMHYRLFRQLMVLCEARLTEMIDIEQRGTVAIAEHNEECKTLAEIDKKLNEQLNLVLSFVTDTGMPIPKARRLVRELIEKIDQHNQRLIDDASDGRSSPGPNDPRNFLDLRIPFPVHPVW